MKTDRVVVRDFIAAFAGGDLGRAAQYLAEDVCLRVGGSHALAGHRTGRDAWLEFATALHAAADGSFRVVSHDVLVGDDHVAALIYCHATTPSGARLEWRRLAVYHVQEHEIRAIWLDDLDDRVALEAFGPPASEIRSGSSGTSSSA